MRLFFIIFILGCNSSDNVVEKLPSISDFYEHEVGTPAITITRDGVSLVKATSNILVKNKSSNAILQGNVEADFFNEEGLLISTLTSDSAYIDQNTNNLHAYGNVVVVSSNDSVRLESNSILWDNHYELITSQEFVKFTSSSGDKLTGVGFESDMDLSQWRIKKPKGVKNN